MEKPSYGLIYHVLRTLLYPWISRVRILNADLHTLKQLEEKGRLIFVGYAASLIDFMVINEQLRREGLQSLHFTHGFSPFLVMPFRRALRAWWRRLFKGEEVRRETELEELGNETARGGHGLVFLKKAVRFNTRVHYFNGFFGRIAVDERIRGTSTFFIPTSVFLTRMRKKNVKRTFFDIFFGTYDIPGKLRKAYMLLANPHKGGTIFSKHIDLNAELEKHDQLEERNIEKRLRWTLLFHLNNEDRAYRGPNKRSRGRKVRRILKERRLHRELEGVAQRTGRTLESVYKEADKTLHEIASDTSERVINLLRALFDFVWARTLEGIDFKQTDIDRIREWNKQGPVVLLPCHRSHVDSLVVAYLFEKRGLNFPRFAAGDNLSKWPLGGILRRAGAFFIRRSFKGETIFPLVFDAYIRHLLRERHVLAFFMEGGRSRTGKLLHPKLGMMSMVLEAWRQGLVDDLPLVPVTLDYGKVFEGEAYLREKGGLEKGKENLAGVLKSRKLLHRNHGVLRLRISDPIYLSQYVADRGHTRESLGFRARIPLLSDLGYTVLNQVNQRVTLTAGNIVAGLLMGNHRRGMTLESLKGLFVISVRYLRAHKVEVTFSEKKLEVALNNALDTFANWDALVRVNVGGEVVVTIPEHKRSEMEYYKNNGLHFILDMALFCMALRSLPQKKRTFERIHAYCREVYDFLDQEFLFQGEWPTMDMLQKTFKAMEVIDALQLDDKVIVYGEYRLGRELVQINAHMLLNFLESYLVVAEVLMELGAGEGPDQKVLLKQCMVKARLLYAVGTLRRQESLNHVTFINALEKFNKLGLIQKRNVKGQKYPQILLKESKREAFTEMKEKLFQWVQRLE